MSDLYTGARNNWKEWAREEMLRRKSKRGEVKIFGMPVEIDDSLPDGVVEIRPFKNPNESIVYDSKSRMVRAMLADFIAHETSPEAQLDREKRDKENPDIIAGTAHIFEKG